MLKYINYQLLDDEEQQKQLERAVAPLISRNIRQNIDAFRQYIPTMLPVIEQHDLQQHSLFCTKEQQLNIVDFATGRVFYSTEPAQEVADELSVYFQQASYFCLDAAKDDQLWRSQPLPAKIDVMMVFGLGLGLHLVDLVSSCRIRFLIVYEPSVDVFVCSVQAANWRDLLDTAAAMGTHIFLQVGNDANCLPSEINELIEFDENINQIFVYRHQFHPVMDDVINYVMQHHGDRTGLTQTSHIFTPYKDYADYVAERAGNVLGVALVSPVKTPDAVAMYEKNLIAFEKFYPKVHKALIDHKTRAWQLVLDPSGQVNLYHQQRRALFHLDPEAETQQLVDYFVNHPYKDDVVLSQRVTRKLINYLHFSKVQEMQPLIDKILNTQSQLPQKVDSLIVFGVALGKHIEILSSQHQIQNLFICEPNLDFFAASLYVTDWSEIFSQADKQKSRVYLNLGGDGSHYFYDLMAQFYQVGAYSIADTYMLSTYYNIGMQKAISDLRAELKVVLALGEYYDHARFGLAHTYHSLLNHHRYLKNSNIEYRDLPIFELPVFIIGNGPSLDNSFEYIKEYRDKVIVISCGTALRSLYKNNIRPDFHAEIEQNRATYDWITQIDDAEFLKEITLLSVNGIHPDTAALFKETLLCFKDGEASTYVFNNGLKKRGIHAASLSYAYPTVTNLVLNYTLKLGFKLFYLFGVDLGFIDINQHHSQHSSYYKVDGTQVYNYQERHGGGVQVKGNFRSIVYTKPEFDVSRKLLEQALANAGRKVEVYNCSDGVRIDGTVSLLPENILLPEQDIEKAMAYKTLLEKAYYPEVSQFADDIFNKFDPEEFKNTIANWQLLMAEDVSSQDEAKALIAAQWALLKKCAVKEKDATFCLFHGSANYMAGILTKLAANINEDSPDVLMTFNQVLVHWRDYVKQGEELFLNHALECDAVDVNYLFTPPVK
jgi:hypothetical protein